MNRPLQHLKNDLTRVLDFLDQSLPFSLSDEERAKLLDEARGILHKLDNLEENFLTMGLLGGTGVGKSTLMNALAGAEIASASHRRPHTDHILIYRHRDAVLPPAAELDGVPWREITHDVDAIRRVLLCDLPDFDSLAGDHRGHVLRFLEHLDVLIWVTSPEKYGDSRFYEFLRVVPKAQQNFLFVLNKVDLLFEAKDMERGYRDMSLAADRFRQHLEEQGVSEPSLYTLSAREATRSLPLSPWNQFPFFGSHVFQQREIKEIRAIKSANLDAEVFRLVSVLQSEVKHMVALEEQLQVSVQELAKEQTLLSGIEKETIRLWLEGECRRNAPGQEEDITALVGPGHALALLFQELRRLAGRDKGFALEQPSSDPPEHVASIFEGHMGELQDRLSRNMLLRNLPAPCMEGLERLLHIPARVETLRKDLGRTLTIHLLEPATPSFRWFRLRQYATYTLLFCLFLGAVGSEAAWKEILSRPGLGSLLQVLLSIVHSLFSTQGLAALGSYLLLNIYLGFRFYRGYRRLMDGAARKTAQAAARDLLGVWQGTLDSLFEDLKRFREDIRTRIASIEAIRTK
ncbi:MAG: 50S ribosome-binding GTPase [Deltaproteobacteria bacterium]|nr:50S ribosome-binding GTPase [Deltaproteobacteria bacterium]